MIGKLKRGVNLVGIMTTGNHLLINRGSKLPLELTVRNDDGSVVDITGGTLFFTVKRSIQDPDSVAFIRKTNQEIKSTSILKDSLASNALSISALNGGAEGDDIRVTTTKTEAVVTALNNGATLDDGATSVTVADASMLGIGSVVEITDGSTSVTVIVDTLPVANVITFAAISIPSSIADLADVKALLFDISVKVGFAVQELHESLSMEPTDASNYFVDQLASNSLLITGLNLNSGSAIGVNRPVDVVDVQLLGGIDPSGGITITNGVEGAATVFLEPSDTINEVPRHYYYDVKYKSLDGLIEDNIIECEVFTIEHAVTRG